ncbi:unnamed protein product [Anisakis simplex]|uniref:Uncharacterized protein n=1 Tax=Anisakis simplex TaxID=6269 RepID=A0A3P6PCT4_ANISI|nr:unnamed protein product [Anisakis simplex]
MAVSFSDSSNLDYVPQFLTTTTIPPTSTVLTNRSWFMNFPSTPTPSLLSSPSTAASSPLMHSPSNATNQTNNSNNNPLLLPSSSSTLLTTTISNNDNSNLMLRSNTPSKGALKAYPSTLQPQKLTDRWTSMANNSAASTSILGTNNSGSIDNTLDMTANALRVQQPWKVSAYSFDCIQSYSS